MSDEIVEISKSRLNVLEQVNSLTNQLWNDPVEGIKIKESVKRKFPNSNLPEVDALNTSRKIESDILAKVEETKKETLARIEAFENSQKERDAKTADDISKQSFATDVETTRKKYQLSPEGMEKVFARMKEKNNPDVEAAAAWVTDHETKAAPINSSGYAPQTLNAFGSTQEDKDWELLNKNPWDMKFADKEINQILTDFNNGRGGLYGPNGMGGEL